MAAGANPAVVGVQLTDLGDGDGFQEPGENVGVAFVIRNHGASATTSALSVGISGAAPDLFVAGADASLPAGLAAFGTDTTTMLVLNIDAGAASGATLGFDAQLSFEGLSSASQQLLPPPPAPRILDTVPDADVRRCDREGRDYRS